MFERFTDRARKVMALANQEAQRLNHEYIDTEHILLGLVKEGSGVGATVLRNLNVDMDLKKLHREVEKLVESGPNMVTMGKLPHTPRAKKIIEYAIEEARSLNHNYVGTEHLLLGLLHEIKESVAFLVLTNFGLTYEQVRNEILNLLNKDIDACGEKCDKPMFQRFSDRARKILSLANQEAQRYNHKCIDTEHILLGFIREGSGVGMAVLKNLNVDIKKLRLDVEKLMIKSPDEVTMGKLEMEPRAKKVIEYAIEGARSLNRNYVGSEHLLLGLMYETKGSISAQVLKNHKLTYEQVRNEIVKLFEKGIVCCDECDKAVRRRFSDRARKVMALANQAAQRYNHVYIDTEHVLLGLVKEGSGVGAVVFKNLNVDVDKLRLEVEELMIKCPVMVKTGKLKLPYTHRIKKIVEYAIEEASSLKSEYVGTEHLLLSMMRETEGIASQVLKDHKLTYEQVRNEIVELTGK
jgi:ATP-dependent Clp protease ATP-binding subunit ClpA